MRCIEDICVFYKKAPKYNPQGLIKLEKLEHYEGRKKAAGVYREFTNGTFDRKYINYPCHILEFNIPSGKNRAHPTQKPVDLLEYLIKTYTDEGEIVLDNCMGSGSIGVACANTGRDFIGIELNEKYFKIASDRITEAFNLRRKEVKSS